MDALLGVFGILGFLGGLIFLGISLLKKNPIKPALAVLGISFLMFCVAIAIAPPSGDIATDLPVEPSVSDELLDAEQEAELEEDEPEETVNEPEKAEDKEEPEKELAVPASTPVPSGQLKAHFIDVGQGDAILIQTPEQNILIDGGDRGTTVVNYLRNQGVNSLDLVIGTHPHADHIGGLINVMEAMPVKEVIDPAIVHTTKTFEDYLTIIDKKNIKFTEGRAGMTRNLGGGTKMQILHPSSPSSSSLNDASIVVQITFGKVSFMLTGDAEQASERQILGKGYDLNSTILKVGHHGSRTSTTESFLKAVNPKVAVIMAGRNNQYGHPHDETLARLAASKVDIYRTDQHGTVVITTNGQTFDVNVKQAYQYNPPKESEPKPTEEVKPQSEPAPDQKEVTVYITDTGSKYHTGSCRHVSKSKIAISLSDAKSKGYTACGVCNPPK